MNVILPPELEAYIEESVRSSAFASASEFVEAAARRQMQEETWFEPKVMEGPDHTADVGGFGIGARYCKEGACLLTYARARSFLPIMRGSSGS